MRSAALLERATTFVILLLALACADPGPSRADTTDPNAYQQDNLQRARTVLQQGDRRAAIALLKQSVREDPDNVETRMLLGRNYLETWRGLAAEKEWRLAMELGANPRLTIIPLARALLMQGKFEQALAATPIIDTDPRRYKVESLMVHGEAYAGLGRGDKARASFSAALALYPRATRAMLGLASLAIAENDLEAAQARIGRVLEFAADDEEALLLQARLYRLRGKLPEALNTLEALTERRPDHLPARLELAQAYLDARKYDQALACTDRVLRERPYLPRVRLFRAKALFARGDKAAAKQELVEVLQFLPLDPHSYLLLGAIAFSDGKLREAEYYLGNEDYFGQFVPRAPRNPAAVKLFAATEMKLGMPDRAVAALERIAPALADDAQLLALLGSAYLQAGDQAHATLYLQQAAGIAPDVSAIHTQLALSQLLQGNSGQAMTELKDALELGSDLVQTEALLVFAALHAGQPEQAAQAAERLLARRPEDPMAYHLLGLAHLNQGAVATAQADFRSALERRADYTPAMLQLARLALQAGDRATAAARYQDILTHHPKHIEAMLGLAHLAATAGRENEVLDWVKRAWQANPAALRPALALARYHLSHNRPDTALTLLRRLELEHPRDPLLLQTLAKAYLAQGESGPALDTLHKLADLGMETAELHYLMARAYLAARDWPAADTRLRRTLALDADYLPALEAHADLLVRLHRFAEAEPLYRRGLALREQMPGADPGQTATTLGNLAGVCRLLGRGNEAESLYRRTVLMQEQALGADHPRVAATLTHHAALLRALGRDAEAEPLLARAEAIDRTRRREPGASTSTETKTATKSRPSPGPAQ